MQVLLPQVRLLLQSKCERHASPDYRWGWQMFWEQKYPIKQSSCPVQLFISTKFLRF